MLVSFKYCRYSCNRLLSTMANALPNAMNKSMIEFICSARQRLETVRHCSGTMAATFPANTLAALKMGLRTHCLWLLKPVFTVYNKVIRWVEKRPKKILEHKLYPSLGMYYLCFWKDVGYSDQDVEEWKPADYAMQFPGLVEDYRKVCGPRLGCEHCISPIGVTWFPETCACGNLGNNMCVWHLKLPVKTCTLF